MSLRQSHSFFVLSILFLLAYLIFYSFYKRLHIGCFPCSLLGSLTIKKPACFRTFCWSFLHCHFVFNITRHHSGRKQVTDSPHSWINYIYFYKYNRFWCLWEDFFSKVNVTVFWIKLEKKISQKNTWIIVSKHVRKPYEGILRTSHSSEWKKVTQGKKNKKIFL